MPGAVDAPGGAAAPGPRDWYYDQLDRFFGPATPASVVPTTPDMTGAHAAPSGAEVPRTPEVPGAGGAPAGSAAPSSAASSSAAPEAATPTPRRRITKAAVKKPSARK